MRNYKIAPVLRGVLSFARYREKENFYSLRGCDVRKELKRKAKRELPVYPRANVIVLEQVL